MRMTFWMLGKSGVAVQAREEEDELDEDEETAEEGRVGLIEYVPRLMVTNSLS